MIRGIFWHALIIFIVFFLGSCLLLIYNLTGLTKQSKVANKDGAFSLKPPFFASVVMAQETKPGGAFPSDDAGIAAYVKLDQKINLKEAVKAFGQTLSLSETHAIGTVSDGYVYIDINGWIVAYYKNNAPASKIVSWKINFDNPKVTFTLNNIIKNMSDTIGVFDPTILDKIKYYDFEYPDADKMLILLNTKTPILHISVPPKYKIHEASYSTSETTRYGITQDGKVYFSGGFLNVSVGEPHTFARLNNDGYAIVLIYSERKI